MAVNDLSSIIRPLEVVTAGENFLLKKYDYRYSHDERGGVEVVKILKQIFDAQSVRQITCWSDTLKSTASSDHYLHVVGGYCIGVFYKIVGGRDVPTHFFLRRMEDYYGPFDKWKEDIRFPSEVRKYSVCIILPPEWEMPAKGLRDPHVHGVTQFRVSDLEGVGIHFEDLVDFMSHA